MMNPIMPEDISMKGIPSQQWASLLEIFRFRKFQGIALVRKLHVIGQALNFFLFAVALIGSFWGPPGGIVSAIIFFPIMLFVMACVIRITAELAVSILLVPYMLMNNQQAQGAGAAGVQTVVADDLTAYGVPAQGMHGMAV